MKMSKLSLFLITLALCAGVFFCAWPTAAYASDGEVVSIEEVLSVDAVWLEGDTLHIKVTDTNTGINQTLELSLSDYANSEDEFVSVQAVDKDGNKSNTIQFKNPYYIPPTTTPDVSADINQGDKDTDGGVPDGSKPFTPDGEGTVLDNVQDGDGKEFFSIKTDDGNVFYLIVDRQRTTDNVYLLNAVTEQDLLSLAKPGSTNNGAIPDAQPTQTPEPNLTPTPEPETPSAKTNSSGLNNGSLIFIAIAALAVGGAGYYFKIVKPKKAAHDDESEDYDEAGDDESIYGDYSGGDEGGDAE